MSTLKVNAIQGTDGVERYLARAWVNFNGTGTIAIRDSGNVSSITDNAAGEYTINFTAAFADANYMPLATVSHASGTTYSVSGGTSVAAAPTTTAWRMSVGYSTTLYDPTYVSVAVFH